MGEGGGGTLVGNRWTGGKIIDNKATSGSVIRGGGGEVIIIVSDVSVGDHWSGSCPLLLVVKKSSIRLPPKKSVRS